MKNTYQINASVVDPLHQRIYPAQVIVTDGILSSITPTENLPADAPYILPGFIDSHVHIESSMLLPENFARAAVTHGTVGAVADPHEIANVLGVPGIDFMIENGKQVPFHFWFGLPSCVPCTNMETAGAIITANDTERLMQRSDIGFLAEMMNVPGVLFNDAETLGKLAAARAAHKPIDGHAPGLQGEGLQKYAAQGITTDHECTTLEEAEERLKTGICVLIREGSAAHDFETISPLLATHADGLMFCTDDLHPDNLLHGHINQLVKRAIAKGYPLWNVLRAASVTPVQHYGMPVGLLQQGDSADFVVVDNLQDFTILATAVEGNLFTSLATMPQKCACADKQDAWPNNFHAQPLKQGALHVKPASSMRAIIASNGSLLTGEKIFTPTIEDGNAVSDPSRDILKIMVLNRYEAGKPLSIGFINGFGMHHGAIASTVAHDSHNLVVVGASDEAIITAANALISQQGGIAVVDGEGHIDMLPLPIAGLISPLSHEAVAARYSELNCKAHDLGCSFDAPFMTLAFMALPVIPTLKITDKGLFDAAHFQYTTLEV